jgi:hypothetical protein
MWEVMSQNGLHTGCERFDARQDVANSVDEGGIEVLNFLRIEKIIDKGMDNQYT